MWVWMGGLHTAPYPELQAINGFWEQVGEEALGGGESNEDVNTVLRYKILKVLKV